MDRKKLRLDEPENNKEILQDFENELRDVEFNFKQIIVANDDYKETLFGEFLALKAEPKLMLYLREFITDEEWQKDFANRNAPSSSGNILGGNFHATSKLERKHYLLRDIFHKRIAANKLKRKYYGRLIKNANIVKALDETHKKVEGLANYTLLNINVQEYGNYAKVLAEAVMTEADKLPLAQLQKEIVQHIIEHTKNLFLFSNFHSDVSDFQKNEVLKRYEVLKDFFNSHLNEKLKKTFHNSINGEFAFENKEQTIITIPDQILRELAIIETIFTAQKRKYDKSAPYPLLLDHNGKSGIDGRYIATLDIYSNVPLFNLQLYKQHFTERFESTGNLALLRNQLAEIRGKSEIVRNYFNENLTDKNYTVQNYIKRKKILPGPESIELFEHHSAIVTIYDYQVMELYLGASRCDRPRGMKGNFPYSYSSNNYQLALTCQTMIEFIDATGINEQAQEINKSADWHNSTYLLYYYHLEKSEGKELSESKVETIATKHKLNRDKLRAKLTDLMDNRYTFKDHSNSKTQFRKDYELILPELKDRFPKAYKNVYALYQILISTHNPPKK